MNNAFEAKRNFLAALWPNAAGRGAAARYGVAAGLAVAVALAIALEPAPPPEGGAWYDVDGRVLESADPAYRQVARSELVKPRGVTVVPGSAGKLYSDFRSIGYRLEDVRAGTEAVPRVFVQAIPQDIRQMRSIDTRKAVFIKTMLPLILRVNEELRQTRSRIRDLNDRLSEGGMLTRAESDWLDSQFESYRVTPGRIDVLLRRVDVVPPSLALAQAAEESGWGTSRFALEGRALFGQRTTPDARGMVPNAYAAETDIKVKSFDALLDGVRSYARNLNTHHAYTGFRVSRERMRHGDGIGINSLQLADDLGSYSERGKAYVDTIKTIIRVNNLRELDGARLSEIQTPDITRRGA